MRRFTITFLVLQVLCLFAIIVLGWNGCTRDIPDLLMALCIPLITMSASLAILYRKCGLYLKQQRSSSRILVIISYFVVAIIACALLFFFSASWQTLNDPTNSPIGIVSIFLIFVTIGLGVFLPQKRAESSKNLSSSYTQPQEQRWLNLFDDTPKSRAQLRKLILLDLAFFLVASASVLILAIVLVVINSKCLVFGPILMDFAIDMLFLAWLMAKVISASNKYFFKGVALSCTLQSQIDKILDRLAPAKTKNEALSLLLLTALLNPSKQTKRINESIRSSGRFFHIETEYEITVPPILQGETVVVPAAIQDKRELTFALKYTDEHEQTLERLKDTEAKQYITHSLAIAIKCLVGSTKSDALRISNTIASFILNSTRTPHERDANIQKTSEIIKADLAILCRNSKSKPEEHDELEALVLTLLNGYWRVKPILVRAKAKPTNHPQCANSALEKIAIGCSSIIIRTSQNIPLIRVWNTASESITKGGRWLQRRLTKKRKSFYFSLANADRANSYHLSISGPENTYYAESELMKVNTNQSTVSAESMTATCRCDQSDSRLFVKNGHGFHNMALSASYEDTSHRAMQTICVSTAICLALICFTAFKYVFPFLNESPSPCLHNDMQIIAIFFSVMTFAGLMSVWESLSGQRSEEWVWVSASITMFSSLIGLTNVIYLTIINPDTGFNFFPQIFLWATLVLVEYLIFLGILVALFHKVKLHSSFMSRTPLTRSLAEITNGDTHSDNEDEAEIYYRDLIGGYWADGWLVPSWVALTGSKDNPKDSNLTADSSE